MVKVVRIGLICQQTDEAGIEISYEEIKNHLWRLQKQTRELKNKAVQICWDFQNKSQAHFEKNGTYLKEKEVYGKTLRGYLSACLKSNVDLYSSNICTTTDKAFNEFKEAKKEILWGNRSILSYKKNQPLELHNKTIKLFLKDDVYMVTLKLFNKTCLQRINYPYTSVNFKLDVRDNSQKVVLMRCIDGIYKITASKLIYDEKKRRWMLNLGYEFDTKNNEELDPERILGVDLGIHYPICASVYGEHSRFIIEGGEIEEFRRRIEARKFSLQHQGKYCGDGRIGHGRATRCKPIEDIKDKEACFRDTCNHKYSRSLIDYAIKQRCGTIQMEELSGITKNANRFLKNWSYFDLQSKIEYKAKEAGIQVVKISPNYTSQRCSKCGYIASDNRLSQQNFKCLKCQYEANADYNASQNISIKGIDKIIEKEIKCEL